MKTEFHPIQVILYEGEGAEPIARAERLALTMSLLDRGYSVLRISKQGNKSGFQVSNEIPAVVLGRFSGPLPEFPAREGAPAITARDVRTMDADAMFELVSSVAEELDFKLNSPGQPGAWKPWYPVIDYDRCTNCMQCLSFCLFDVYGVDENNRIQVKNDDNCKTNCPACSRVCPEVAIMFPKYASGPINGEKVKKEDVARESMKIDISNLLGGDIYSSLRSRSEKAKSRFSKERSPDKALAERKRCLVQLQQSGIIPAEVLAEIDIAALPSPEAIERKAREMIKMQRDQKRLDLENSL